MNVSEGISKTSTHLLVWLALGCDTWPLTGKWDFPTSLCKNVMQKHNSKQKSYFLSRFTTTSTIRPHLIPLMTKTVASRFTGASRSGPTLWSETGPGLCCSCREKHQNRFQCRSCSPGPCLMIYLTSASAPRRAAWWSLGAHSFHPPTGTSISKWLFSLCELRTAEARHLRLHITTLPLWSKHNVSRAMVKSYNLRRRLIRCLLNNSTRLPHLFKWYLDH